MLKQENKRALVPTRCSPRASLDAMNQNFYLDRPQFPCAPAHNLLAISMTLFKVLTVIIKELGTYVCQFSSMCIL